MTVCYSSRGLINLIRYLLEKYRDILKFLFLGKIPFDKIEAHFSHLKKLAGGKYWPSARQFMEKEAVLRTNELDLVLRLLFH